MTNPNKIILGLIGAAAAGVALGILLAPEKGGEVRKKIADKANDLACKFGELINNSKGKVDDAANKVADTANEKVDDFSHSFDNAKNSMA